MTNGGRPDRGTSPPIDLPYWSVEGIWPGQTIAILGGGKSLTQDQVDYLRGKCVVVAINRAYQLAPWADMLYGCDAHRFWAWHPDAVNFAGTKVVVREARHMAPSYWAQLRHLSDHGAHILKHSSHDHPAPTLHHEGCSPDPGVVYGNNSCAQILSVIPHTGAKTVLLLGIDMKSGHWHGGYTNFAEPDYANAVAPMFAYFKRDLDRRGIPVLNCTPKSALAYFPAVSLEAVI